MSTVKAKLRQLIFQTANFQCEYCRSPQDFLMADLEIDHILPKVKGGKTLFENLCAVCRKCNERKGSLTDALDSDSGKSSPLFNPRTQAWSDHFEFSVEGSLILGKSTTGRVTVETLQLNRKRAVLLRRMWRKAGWRPPHGL
jgi:hypothetical protein